MMTAQADVTLSISKSVADIRIASITLNFQGHPKVLICYINSLIPNRPVRNNAVNPKVCLHTPYCDVELDWRLAI